MEYRIAHLMELRGQLKQTHWNIRDPLFYFLHQKFDEMLKDSASVVELGDSVSSDVLIEATSEIDKILWFLESHLAEEVEKCNFLSFREQKCAIQAVKPFACGLLGRSP